MMKQQALSSGYRFVKPEIISDLRKQEEMALKNKQEWTRVLPPPPVLPPYGPLEKISGRLEVFSSECFLEYFGVQAYRNNTLPRVSGAQRGSGAAAAIVAGSPAAGMLLADSSITRSQKDYAEYVQGSINGVPFRGWVGMTRLQAGDSVDMAAEWRGDHYEVYAIAKPEERIVSVCPGCDRGHIAEGWLRFRNMLILTAVFIVGMCITFVIGYLNGDISSLEKIISSMWMFFLISLSISGCVALSAYKAYAPTSCRLSQEIFILLGLKDVGKISLKRITSKREREKKITGEWYSPDNKKQPPLPSQKFIYPDENWFYY